MRLKREDGYYSLAKSTVGDYIRGSGWLKKHGKKILGVFALIWFFVLAYWFQTTKLLEGLNTLVALAVLFGTWFGSLAVPLVLIGRLIYGSFRGYKKDVELPRAEFHTLGTCQGYGKRILNMVGDLNVGDHYIFLLNFHNLFYHEDHKLENPDQGMLNAIGRAVGVLPERSGGTVWTRNPFRSIGAGLEAGRKAGDEQTVKYITEKLGGLPQPREAVAIITKEYLPELLKEFPRDVAMYIAVVICTANKYTAVFPYDERVVTEEEAIKVASNPTRKNVVNYCSRFAGLQAEEPVARRRGLMEGAETDEDWGI